MRFLNEVVLSAANDVTRTSGKVDVNQIVNMSFQGYCSDADAAGTIKIQASNDPVPNGATRQQFTPTHWVDIPNAVYTITAGSPGLITLSNVSYGYVRAIYTETNTGTGTIVVQISGVGA